MNERNAILVGLDHSEADHAVLASARRLADRLGAKLLLAHVVAMRHAAMEAVTAPVASLEPTALDEAQTYLDAAAKLVTPGQLLGTIAVYGAAARALCELAIQHDARLIVVGARGAAKTSLLGSTASALVNHSARSVYVARDVPGRELARVLVGCDGSDLSKDVLRAASEIASGEQRRLLLFRAVESADAPLEPTAIERAKLELRAYATLIDARLPHSVHARAGEPWRALCDAARDYEADVIAIGAHSHNAVARALGTTAARVVEHAAQSVLVVKQ